MSRRSRAKSVSKKAIDQVGTSLQALPEKSQDTLSLRQAIEQLQVPIRAALAKGYSYDDLAAALTEQGIAIRVSTLKQYVPSGSRRSPRKSATAAKTKRPRNAQPQAAAAHSEAVPEAPEQPAGLQSDAEPALQPTAVEPENGRRSRRKAESPARSGSSSGRGRKKASS